MLAHLAHAREVGEATAAQRPGSTSHDRFMMPPTLHAIFERWHLDADGPVVQTGNATLAPVRWRGQPAMVKIAHSAEEQRGYALLAWWRGQGAVRILAQDGAALLMARATGASSLASLSRNGRDQTACRILCAVTKTLHETAHAARPPALPPLALAFEALRATRHPALAGAQASAQTLLAQPQDVRPLHGDIHHQNVLDFGPRGWQAIDPKGWLGERGFDYANLFCNPDLAIAADRQTFLARLALVSQLADLPPRRLLLWIHAWAGLSAAWHLEDNTEADAALALVTLAEQVLPTTR